jgi:hypothetical protein
MRAAVEYARRRFVECGRRRFTARDESAALITLVVRLAGRVRRAPDRGHV